MDKIETLNTLFGGSVAVRDGKVSVSNPGALTGQAMDRLVYAAVFGEQDERDHARWLIWEIGQEVGVRAASIHDLYLARGRGDAGIRRRHGLRRNRLPA